jgi:hypothetical protein
MESECLIHKDAPMRDDNKCSKSDGCGDGGGAVLCFFFIERKRKEK